MKLFRSQELQPTYNWNCTVLLVVGSPLTNTCELSANPYWSKQIGKRGESAGSRIRSCDFSWPTYMGCAKFGSYFGQNVQPPSLFYISNYGCKCKCNLFTHGAPRSSQELAQKFPCVPGSNVNLETLVFMERGKSEYPEKNLSVQSREPTTNSTHIWRQFDA